MSLTLRLFSFFLGIGLAMLFFLGYGNSAERAAILAGNQLILSRQLELQAPLSFDKAKWIKQIDIKEYETLLSFPKQSRYQFNRRGVLIHYQYGLSSIEAQAKLVKSGQWLLTNEQAQKSIEILLQADEKGRIQEVIQKLRRGEYFYLDYKLQLNYHYNRVEFMWAKDAGAPKIQYLYDAKGYYMGALAIIEQKLQHSFFIRDEAHKMIKSITLKQLSTGALAVVGCDYTEFTKFGDWQEKHCSDGSKIRRNMSYY